MRGTSVEQPDPFTHGELPAHLLPALGTLVQLLPASTFRWFVIAQTADSWTVVCIGSTPERPCVEKVRPARADVGYNGANSGIKMQIPVERKVICDL